MVEPNWTLMLWFILIMWIIKALFDIPTIMLLWGEEKTYGAGDMVMTFLIIIFVICILFM